jgi:hypothetical protein
VFTNFTEKDMVIGRVGFVDFLTSLRGSEEIAPLAAELDLFSIGDEELFRAVKILDISRLVDLVRYLVVNEDTFGSFTCEEIFKDLRVLG